MQPGGHCRTGPGRRHCGEFWYLRFGIVNVATECVAAKNDAADRLLPECHMGASLVLWLSMGEAEMIEFLERAQAGGYLKLHDHQAPTTADNCICTVVPESGPGAAVSWLWRIR